MAVGCYLCCRGLNWKFGVSIDIRIRQLSVGHGIGVRRHEVVRNGGMIRLRDFNSRPSVRWKMIK